MKLTPEIARAYFEHAGDGPAGDRVSCKACPLANALTHAHARGVEVNRLWVMADDETTFTPSWARSFIDSVDQPPYCAIVSGTQCLRILEEVTAS